MIFSDRDATRIASGRKTRHTIPANRSVGLDAGDTFPVTVMVRNRDLGYQRKRRPKLKPHQHGHLTSARPTTDTPRKEGHTRCHCRVLARTETLLHEITFEEVLAEGHATTEDFLAWWRDRYAEGPGKPGNPEYPIHIPVTVLDFEVDVEQHQRYLARASDVNRGYTESPSAAVTEDGGPLWAVEDEYLARFADEAADTRLKERRRAEREAIQRLPALLEDFDDPSTIERQLRAIKREVDTIERKRKRAA